MRSIQRWEGWDARVPSWLGLGPALPTLSGLGLQAASAFSSRPPRAQNQIFPLPCSDSLIASDSKCIALIFSHFARMGFILTSLSASKASQRQEGCIKVGGKCRGWAVNGAAAVMLGLIWPCLYESETGEFGDL